MSDNHMVGKGLCLFPFAMFVSFSWQKITDMYYCSSGSFLLTRPGHHRPDDGRSLVKHPHIRSYFANHFPVFKARLLLSLSFIILCVTLCITRFLILVTLLFLRRILKEELHYMVNTIFCCWETSMENWGHSGKDLGKPKALGKTVHYMGSILVRLFAKINFRIFWHCMFQAMDGYCQ